MNKLLAIGAAALLLTACGSQKDNNEVNIQKQTIQLENDQMTPEALLKMPTMKRMRNGSTTRP